MVERIRWATGQKVRVVDRSSPHVGKVGILKTLKQFPIVGNMPYRYWFVEIDGNSVLLTEDQLARIE